MADLIVTELEPNVFMFEHADLKGGPYMNFEGREKQYNREGDRNFHLCLPEELAQELEERGWNITWPKPQDDIDEEDRFPRVPSVECKVEYRKGRPPKIHVITSGAPQGIRLKEDTVDMLDAADMANVDLIIRGNKWRDDAMPCIKAYVRTMYVTLNEDPLERKYGGGKVETLDDDDELDGDD